MVKLPCASVFAWSISSMPFCVPSLLSATVAPACGLPVVRLMTVPVTAAIGGGSSEAAENARARSSLRHLHGLAAFAAEFQVLVELALQCGADVTSAGCAFGRGCGRRPRPGAGVRQSSRLIRSTSASTPASSFCRSFLVCW